MYEKSYYTPVLQEIGLLPISLYTAKIAIRNWERIQEGKAYPLLLTSNHNPKADKLPWAMSTKDALARNMDY